MIVGSSIDEKKMEAVTEFSVRSVRRGHIVSWSVTDWYGPKRISGVWSLTSKLPPIAPAAIIRKK